jgi:D-alanyl-D-alanine carboxypeptidase
MTMLKKVSSIAAATCLAVAVGAGTAAAAPADPGPREQHLQRALDRVVSSGAPGAIALVREHGHTVSLASGYADVKAKRAMRPSDRVRVGSITKTFVATVVLQLAAEGKLSLDDSVERWVPDLVPNGEAITVRRLLNMTSGLFDYLNDGDPAVVNRLTAQPELILTPADLVGISTAHPPRFAPGASWSYCNTCYILLGMVIERATGRPVATELRDRIFTPVGLRATTFETGPRIAGRHAHGYDSLAGSKVQDLSELNQSWAWTAGAIVSTADDVARFYRALLGGRLLRPDLLQAMKTTVHMGDAPRGYGYGFGIFAQPMGCGTSLGHTGGTPGYVSFAFSSAGAKRQAVILVNRGDDSMSPRTSAAMKRVLRLAYCG